MMSYLVGIDPGLTGAVALVDDKGNLISVQDTPVLEVKRGSKDRTVYCDSLMATILTAFKDLGDIRMVGLEQLHAMKEGTSSNFSCGLGSGLWRGIIAALRLPMVLIPPRTWKKALGLPTGAQKGESLERALRLYPTAPLSLKKHHGRADAILIAEHVRRQFGTIKK
jgi:crossover junction endodeoxyribonuclease RuvC